MMRRSVMSEKPDGIVDDSRQMQKSSVLATSTCWSVTDGMASKV